MKAVSVLLLLSLARASPLGSDEPTRTKGAQPTPEARIWPLGADKRARTPAGDAQQSPALVMASIGTSACLHILAGKTCDSFATVNADQQRMVHSHAHKHLRGEIDRAHLEICKKVALVLEGAAEKKADGIAADDHCKRVFHPPSGDAHAALKKHIIGGARQGSRGRDARMISHGEKAARCSVVQRGPAVVVTVVLPRAYLQSLHFSQP